MTFEGFLDSDLDALARYAAVLAGSRDDAHDLLADVLIEARTKWSRIGAMASPGGYVRSMVTSRFVDQRRRTGRARTRTALVAQMPEVPAGGGESAVDDLDQITRLLAVLSPRQRAALVLRYYLDFPDRAIAHELGCTSSTVRSLVARGLATLREATTASPAPWSPP